MDYGTTEYVNPDFIFPELMFEDVPKLCIEVEFYGLKPVSVLFLRRLRARSRTWVCLQPSSFSCD